MPLEILGAGAIAAYLSKDGLEKLLGPTAEYLGGEIKEFTKKRTESVYSIFANATNKIPKERQDSGAVPPKVLKTIINEGSYAIDLVSVEYFGGILASSKTEEGRDDRGARYSQMISSMSSYEIRAHYVLYNIFSEKFKGQNATLNHNRELLKIFIPLESFVDYLDFTNEELNNAGVYLSHIFDSLSNDGLINENWSYGPMDYLRKDFPDIKEAGAIITPTTAGADLFLWAFGKGMKESNFLFNPQFEANIDGIRISTNGVIELTKKND